MVRTLSGSLIKPFRMSKSLVTGRLVVESSEVGDGSTKLESLCAERRKHIGLHDYGMVCSGSRLGLSVIDVQQSTAKIASKARSFSGIVNLTGRSSIKCK